MKVLEFIDFYKDILPQSEHEAFSKAAKGAKKGKSAICASLIARYDVDLAIELLASGSKEKTDDACKLALFAIALESVYIRSKNEEILNTGYVFLTNCLFNMEKESIDQPFFLAVVCDKLRFFDSVLKRGEKERWIEQRNIHLNNAKASPLFIEKLACAYLMAFSLEEADLLFSSTTPPLFSSNSEQDLAYWYFILHGLMTYGYDDKATEIKYAIFSSYLQANLSPSAAALLAEIALLG